MAYVEKQRHGKHDYYYLVKSVRTAPGKVMKVRVSLGRSIPSHEKMQAFFAELDQKTLKKYTPELLSPKLCEQVDDLRFAAQTFYKTTESTNDFLVRFTYNSNAIEGNPLTLRQTALILAEGITPQGVKTENVLEALNGRDAWEKIKKYRGKLDKKFISSIQKELTKNTSCRIIGEYRDSEVRIAGSNWRPPAASQVEKQCAEAFGEFNEKRRAKHPVELAAWVHNKIVQIHPFTDGNGRTARLIMNWVLLQNSFPPVVIDVQNKEEYYKAIEDGDEGKQKTFAEFLASQLIKQYTNKQN